MVICVIAFKHYYEYTSVQDKSILIQSRNCKILWLVIMYKYIILLFNTESFSADSWLCAG